MDETKEICVFLGIDVPVSSDIARVQQEVKQGVESVRRDGFAIEPHPHSTLAYIGGIDRALLSEGSALDKLCIDVARKMSATLCVTITNNAMLLGSDAIVLLLDDPSGGLGTSAKLLHANLSQAANRSDLKFLPFIPHVTLGRVKKKFMSEHESWVNDQLIPAISLIEPGIAASFCVPQLILYECAERGALIAYDMGTGKRRVM